ncbi:MAG: hypothetical protein ACI97N_001905 [Cognaticolwellia sp.]|jgi:hypothetical protein|tara:strand:+ start:267 stop:485 length:219 start_codon:yes stop_codon:yes gene_type:complete
MIGLIIYPTYIEYQPRLILKAISKGIPVITTTACGISSSEKVTVINTGNYEQLKATVLTHRKVIKSSFKIGQ